MPRCLRFEAQSFEWLRNPNAAVRVAERAERRRGGRLPHGHARQAFSRPSAAFSWRRCSSVRFFPCFLPRRCALAGAALAPRSGFGQRSSYTPGCSHTGPGVLLGGAHTPVCVHLTPPNDSRTRRPPCRGGCGLCKGKGVGTVRGGRAVGASPPTALHAAVLTIQRGRDARGCGVPVVCAGVKRVVPVVAARRKTCASESITTIDHVR
jgi:hypothetical protein